MTEGVTRLAEVMHTLRSECPWDAQQTHASLVTYLVEEMAEVVEAIEAGDDAHLREELGDLLLQVVFHSEIAAEDGRFTLADVADQIADKLIRRHPYVFATEAVPDDLHGSWEARKRAEKGRTSALDGVPHALDTLARATKVVSRSRLHGVDVALPDSPIAAHEVGSQIVGLVARAHASGVDADQATRMALRELESQVRVSENESPDEPRV